MHQHRSTTICKQMLTHMKGEINSNTIIVGDFNITLTPMDRSTKQKISKETETLNDTTDQLDLTDIFRMVPNMLLEISGEITPERMKGWSQSKKNTQLWM